MTASDVDRIAAELAGTRFFARFPPELTRRLAACAEPVQYEADTVIGKEGSPADAFWVIQHGRIAVGVRTPNRGLAVIETLAGGDILGWSWLLPPHRWHFDAVATRPVTAIRVNSACLLPYLTEEPTAGYAVLRAVADVMAERLRSARLRLVDMYGAGDDDD